MGADDMLDEPPTLPTLGADVPPADPPADPAPAKKDTRPRRSRSAAATKKAAAAKKEAAAKKRERGGRPTAPQVARRELQRQLEESFAMLGFGVMALGTSPAIVADGQAVIERAGPLAESLATLAEQNETVRRILTTSLAGSAWFGVIGAFGGLGVAIAQNHGVIPAGDTLDPSALVGNVDPDTLAAMFGGDPPAANGAP